MKGKEVSDLVTRLRDHHKQVGMVVYDISQEAADRIDRLEAINAELLGACRYALARLPRDPSFGLVVEELDAAIDKATGGEG